MKGIFSILINNAIVRFANEEEYTMKVNTLISTCKKTPDRSKVRDGRTKKAAALRGIGISLLAMSLSAPALADHVKTNLGSTGPLSSGETITREWWNANSAAYLLHLKPHGAGFNNPCQLEVLRLWSVQSVRPDGTLRQDIRYQIKNVGSITCSADRTLVRFP